MVDQAQKYDDLLITINDSSVDVTKIVNQINDSIKKNKVKYIKELQKKLPSVIDTVENSEFLLSGWYESESIDGQRAKWTEKEFSFLFNPENSRKLNLNIISTPPNVTEKPLKLSLFFKNKLIDYQEIKKSGNQVINFDLPKEYQNKNLVAEIKLSYTFSPIKEHKKVDTRKLGIAVKRIGNLPYTDIGNRYIPKLTEFETQAPLEMEKIKYHINPQNLLPQETRLKFFKKLILRIISVYTSIQIGFNQQVHQFLNKNVDYLKAISDYVKSLDAHIASQNKEMAQLKQQINEIKVYQSKFWHKKEEEFYNYHQNYFRGSYQSTKKNLQIYDKYLQPADFYKKAPFIDFGPGRGEFLEILKEKNVNSIGVDINKIFVDQLKTNGYQVVHNDALKFLFNYNNKIGGASAFHLIEHLTFTQVFDFLFTVHQLLKEKGVLLLETPNLNNLTVGATTFHFDPTHKTKLPPLLLRKTLEFIGYSKIESLELHPEKETSNQDEVHQKIFGPQDYGIIAQK